MRHINLLDLQGVSPRHQSLDIWQMCILKIHYMMVFINRQGGVCTVQGWETLLYCFRSAEQGADLLLISRRSCNTHFPLGFLLAMKENPPPGARLFYSCTEETHNFSLDRFTDPLLQKVGLDNSLILVAQVYHTVKSVPWTLYFPQSIPEPSLHFSVESIIL